MDQAGRLRSQHPLVRCRRGRPDLRSVPLRDGAVLRGRVPPGVGARSRAARHPEPGGPPGDLPSLHSAIARVARAGGPRPRAGRRPGAARLPRDDGGGAHARGASKGGHLARARAVGVPRHAVPHAQPSGARNRAELRHGSLRGEDAPAADREADGRRRRHPALPPQHDEAEVRGRVLRDGARVARHHPHARRDPADARTAR